MCDVSMRNVIGVSVCDVTNGYYAFLFGHLVGAKALIMAPDLDVRS